MQRLTQCGLLRPVLQDVPTRQPEGDQEVVRAVRHVDVLCRSAVRVAVEGMRNARDLAQDVEQHLRRQPARLVGAEQRAPERARIVRAGRELVGARVQDRAMEGLESVPVADEELRQPIQQLRVRRLVRGPEVIVRLHDAGAKILVPDAVDRSPCEVRILSRDDPIGQDFAPVVSVRDVGRGAAQELRRHLPLGGGMLDLALFVHVPSSAVRAVAVLDPQAGEECRQAVEVVLRVVLQGMVVAFGALHAHAKEQPRHRWRHLGNAELLEHEVRGGMPEVRGGVEHGVPGARQQRSHEFVVWPVVGQPIPDPVLEDPHRAALRVQLAVAEPVLEPHSPMRGVLRPLEQSVDQARALVRAAVLQEGAHLARFRQQADGVEIDPPHEFPIRCRIGRPDVHLPELGKDRLVDEVTRLVGGIVRSRHRIHDADLRGRHLAHRTRRDSHQSPARCSQSAVGSDLGDAAVVREVAHRASHVSRAAIGQASDRDHPLFCARTHEHALGRIQLQPFQAGAAAPERRSLAQPAEDRLVLFGIRFHQPTAAMSLLKGGLAQQQALLGVFQVDALPLAAGNDRVVVSADVVPKQ